jgi:hypothetical protein
MSINMCVRIGKELKELMREKTIKGMNPIKKFECHPKI